MQIIPILYFLKDDKVFFKPAHVQCLHSFSLSYISYLRLRDSRTAEGLVAGNSRLRHRLPPFPSPCASASSSQAPRDSCVLRPSHAFS